MTTLAALSFERIAAIARATTRLCPRCTRFSFEYQGGGHWYCEPCDTDGWDEEPEEGD